jgi:hypothetical protein
MRTWLAIAKRSVLSGGVAGAWGLFGNASRSAPTLLLSSFGRYCFGRLQLFSGADMLRLFMNEAPRAVRRSSATSCALCRSQSSLPVRRNLPINPTR